MTPTDIARAMALAGLVSVPAAASADAVLDVAGSVTMTTPRLEVRVTLTNRGATAAGPIEVRGELFGESREARLSSGLAPGAHAAVTLDFRPAASRPGLHALTLLLEYPLDGLPDGAGNLPVDSQRAFLLLALGASPGEAVRIEAEPLTLEVRGQLVVRLQSRDGEAQRVRLRAVTARGLRPDSEPVEVDVPAEGLASARLPIAVAGVPRGRRQALLLVAENLDGPLARTSVAAAFVELRPDPAVLPRVRQPLLLGGVALVAFALGYQLWARLRARAASRA